VRYMALVQCTHLAAMKKAPTTEAIGAFPTTTDPEGTMHNQGTTPGRMGSVGQRDR